MTALWEATSYPLAVSSFSALGGDCYNNSCKSTVHAYAHGVNTKSLNSYVE